ncbi:MAG: acyloxyacyl hydrolase [Longimicrobiales bacterium]
MRGSLRLLVLLLSSAVPADVHARQSASSLSVTLTHSFGSSTAAHPGPCGATCIPGDVLAPLSLSTLEIELALPLRTRPGWGLEYHVRVVPLALMTNNPTQPALRGPLGWTLSPTTSRASTLGIGVKPVGLRVWGGSNRVRIEADAAGGMLRFGTPLLASNAKRVNFAYEFGAGMRLGPSGVVLGYRRHHVSNAGFGEVNPGLDSHVLYLGVPVG